MHQPLQALCLDAYGTLCRIGDRREPYRSLFRLLGVDPRPVARLATRANGDLKERASVLAPGRDAGGKGDYDRALGLLAQAAREAPRWPYPAYAAFTHLLKGDMEKAEEYHAAVDKMAPRGFFTAKTAL